MPAFVDAGAYAAYAHHSMASHDVQEEREVFASYLTRHRLKRSEQREAILNAFLESEDHLSVDDLLGLVHRRRPDVGRTTVYRTLKLLREAGLASELQVGGETRFERDYKREHHDHLICDECGEIIEFSSPEIERLQEEIAHKLGFTIKRHRHQIFGSCQRSSCSGRPERQKQG
jgi:Fur family ferric uptake transcriptional regulator